MELVGVVPMSPRLTALLNHARPTAGPAANWYRFENADGGDADMATLTVYDEIGWFGLTDSQFAEQLAQVTARNLTVRLSSPGGSVFQGITIANALRSHPARVTVSVDGLAASIASVIMLAGDEIIVQPQSQVMIHKAAGVCIGDDDAMEEMRDLLRKQSENIARAYASRAGGRWDSWYNKMAAETWYTAEEAVAAGLADRLAQYPRKGKPAEEEPEPDMATAAKTETRVWDLSVFRYAGREKAPHPDTADIAAHMQADNVAIAQGITDALATADLADLTDTGGAQEPPPPAPPGDGQTFARGGVIYANTPGPTVTGERSPESFCIHSSSCPDVTNTREFGGERCTCVAGEFAGLAPQVNITVNGTVDPAAIAREVDAALARFRQRALADPATVEHQPGGHLASSEDSEGQADAGAEAPAEPATADTAPTGTEMPADDWAAAAAHLLAPSADGWADAIRHLKGAAR